MDIYEILYVTNLPAFYKVNLFNRISTKRKIFVIFLKENAADRNEDFYRGKRKFDFISLDKKFIFNKIHYLNILLRESGYQNLIIDGWNDILSWFCAFKSPVKKNSVVVESSIFESSTNGLKGLLKRLFLKRFSRSFASGSAQEDLLHELGFKGTVITTKGVGLFNIVKQPEYYRKAQVINYIYVGRLSKEKNLEYLVNTFNRLPYLNLNIIGYGPMEAKLRKIAGENIIFHGPVDNLALTTYYRKNDVLILPSLSEPWGLVVEEALNNGLPVIVSEKVGCIHEVVKNDYNGIIFSLSEANSLEKAINKITNIDYYNTLRINISKMDFGRTAEYQVNSYL